jgi:hypothetical protein
VFSQAAKAVMFSPQIVEEIPFVKIRFFSDKVNNTAK